MSSEEEFLDDAEESRPVTSTDRKGAPAVIWSYFKKVNNVEAKCNICQKTLKTPTGSTTALIRHIKQIHPFQHTKYLKDFNSAKDEKLKKKCTALSSTPKQPKLTDMFAQREKWAPSHSSSKLITSTIGKWMAKSLHPYSLVEEEGFVELVRTLQPKYEIPSRTTFSRRIIPELFSNTKNNIQNLIELDIKNGLRGLSITTDLWTSGSNDSFLAVTCHYINRTFKLKSFCLDNCYFPEEHTGVNIAITLNRILSEYKICQSPTMPIFCITDNGSNMVKAITSHTEWEHLRCFAHSLQRALDSAKKDTQGMTAMISKAKAIVGHYKHSSVAQTRLNKLRQQLGQKELTLFQDCETRWNSEYKMFSRLLEMRQAISADLASVSKPDNLNNSEWELVEGYVKLLKPLDDASNLASNGRFPTLSMVLPLLDGIKSVIANFIASKSKGVTFARSLEKAFTTRFSAESYWNNKIYLLAMVVDPRFKMVLLNEEEQKNATGLLLEETMHSVGEGVETSSPSSSHTNPEGACGEEEKLSLWHNFQMLSKKKQAQDSEQDVRNAQIKAYLAAPDVSMEEDPCIWWEQNSNIYHFVSPVAQKYLGIPATEVASERIFSSAGNVCTERRRRLTQEHIRELVFLHHNL